MVQKKEIPLYNIDNLSVFNQKDILISEFAPYLAIHKNLHLPHKHSFYHLLLFTEGSGSHDIDFNIFPVRPYQIYFMIPGQVHSWNFEGHVDGFVVNFSEQFFQSFLLKRDYLDQLQFFKGNVIESVIDIPEGAQDEILAIFKQLLCESEAAQIYALDMVKALLLRLFYIISRFCNRHQGINKSSHNYVLLNNFKRLIEDNYTSIRLPKEYAELLHVTPNHLNAVCNEILGRSAGEVIRDRVVLEAKRLMVNQELSISEIAYKLNFSDNSYFSKFFKKHVGVGPEEFRAKQLLL